MRSSTFARFAATALAGVLAVSTLTMTVQAQGQPGGGQRAGGGGPGGIGREFLEPPVTTRDLELFNKTLALTPDQLETAKALLEGATAEYQPIAKAMRDKSEAAWREMRESGDFAPIQALAGQMTEVRQARAKVEASFMNDFKALLSPEQAERWPAAERAQRRAKVTGRGPGMSLSGERVDLVRLVDRLELAPDDKASLAETMEQYEVELDRELVRRAEALEKLMDQGVNLANVFMNGGGDADKAQESFEKVRAAATRARDVNRKYARLIEPMLPEDKRAQFAQDFKRESFPMVYRPTHAARVLDAAEKLPDLDENQKAGLTAARESFTRENAALNTRYEAAFEEMETSFDIRNMRGGGAWNNPKMQGLRESRQALEDQTIQKVQSLLNEAQRTKLPERESRGDGPQRWRGDDGGGRGGAGPGGAGGEGDAARPQRRARPRGGRQQTDTPPRNPV